jgi:hypothetical protein
MGWASIPRTTFAVAGFQNRKHPRKLPTPTRPKTPPDALRPLRGTATPQRAHSAEPRHAPPIRGTPRTRPRHATDKACLARQAVTRNGWDNHPAGRFGHSDAVIAVAEHHRPYQPRRCSPPPRGRRPSCRLDQDFQGMPNDSAVTFLPRGILRRPCKLRWGVSERP